METEVGDDAFDAALADGEVFLNQLLGDDFDGAVGIEESLGDDATDDFWGAAMIGLGTRGLGLKGLGTAFAEGSQELVVALAAVAEARGNLCHRAIGTLTGDEHGELLGEDVGRIDGELAAGSTETEGIRIDGEGHGGKEGGKENKCPIKYGVFLGVIEREGKLWRRKYSCFIGPMKMEDEGRMARVCHILIDTLTARVRVS